MRLPRKRHNASVAAAAAIVLAVVTCLGKITCQSLPTDYLASFSTKLMIGIQSNAIKDDMYKIYELEEYYDRERQLAKLVANKNDGSRSELYVRVVDQLYLRVDFNPHDKLIDCEMTEQMPTSGPFSEFQGLITMKPSDPAFEFSESLEHVVGPSVLVYLFKEKLNSQWQSKATSKKSLLSNVTAADYLRLHQNRLNFGAQLPEYKVKLGDGYGRVAFIQSNFLIDRAPLMNELTTAFRFVNNLGDAITVNYRSIRARDFATQAFRDPFKMPVGFTCIKDLREKRVSPQILSKSSMKLDSNWATRLYMGSDWASARLHSLKTRPNNVVGWTMDRKRGMFVLDFEGESRNVIDTRRQILYHLPEETPLAVRRMSSTVEQRGETQVGQLMGTECSIISTGQSLLFDRLSFNMASTGEEKAHNYLIGHTNSLMYLGKTRLGTSQLAHEFEILYVELGDLPAHFGVLSQSSVWYAAKTPNDLLVAKLWVNVRDYCTDLYGKFTFCVDPKILGYRLSLIDSQSLETKLSEEMNFNEFMWELDDLEPNLEPSGLFDVSSCPLKSVDIRFKVGWSITGGDNLSKTQSTHMESLDGYVESRIEQYLDSYTKNEIWISKFERTHHPGTRVAHYTATLAEKPREAISFKASEEKVKLAQMKSKSIATNLDVKNPSNPFECLTWASLFQGENIATLFSPKGGCHVYESHDLDTWVKTNQEEEYTIYTRTVEASSPYGVEFGGIAAFKDNYLPAINSHLLERTLKANENTVLLDARTKIQDIRMSQISMSRFIDEIPAEELSEQSVLVRSNFNFVERAAESSDEVEQRTQTRSSFESLSFSHCSNKCHSDENCASFSYCRYSDSRHEFCQMSDLNFFTPVSQDIGNQLKQRANCEIYGKNFISFFDKSLERATSSENWYEVDVKSFVSIQTCASICYDLISDAICRRFAFKKESVGYNVAQCFVWLSEPKNSTSEIHFKPVDEPYWVGQLKAAELVFERRTISMYRKTLSGPFEWSGDIVQSTMKTLSADKCADECLGNYECQSFDSCQVTQDQVSWVECTLLGGSVLDKSIEIVLVPKSSDESKDSRICDHYEWIGEIQKRSGQELDLIMREFSSNSRSNSSHSMLLVVTACIGLALGLMTAGIIGSMLKSIASCRTSPAVERFWVRLLGPGWKLHTPPHSQD